MKQRKPPGAHTPAIEMAQQLAVAALGFIADDPDQLGRFLAWTGIGPESIRTAAREPGFLLGVLDYVAADEPLLIAFAEHCAVDPSEIVRARDALAGGQPDVP